MVMMGAGLREPAGDGDAPPLPSLPLPPPPHHHPLATLENHQDLWPEGGKERSCWELRAAIAGERLLNSICGRKLFSNLRLGTEGTGESTSQPLCPPIPQSLVGPAHWQTHLKARGDEGAWVMSSTLASDPGRRAGFYSFFRQKTMAPGILVPAQLQAMQYTKQSFNLADC